MVKGTGCRHTNDDRAQLLVKSDVPEENYVSRNFVYGYGSVQHSKRES